MSDITCYLFFSVLLTSLGMIISRSISVATNSFYLYLTFSMDSCPPAFIIFENPSL